MHQHVKNLYESLGVSRTATADEIKKAYRQITRQHHPDRNPGNKAAEEAFKAASSAYEVLSDAERRKLYDEFGEASLTQGFDAARARAYKRAQSRASGFSPGGGTSSSSYFEDFGEARSTSFDDLLSRLFGGGRVRNDYGPTTRAGPDVRGDITVSFLDALNGTTVPLRVESQDGSFRTLDVKVPAGATDGTKLRVRGQGGAGDPPGDILLTVRVTPHPRLTRDGNDLRMSLPVTALEAYRGGPIDVPTPGGVVSIKLPPGSQNGQTLRLRGKGVQLANKPAGDLFVTLDVRMPTRAGHEKLLEALAELQGREDPRAELVFS